MPIDLSTKRESMPNAGLSLSKGLRFTDHALMALHTSSCLFFSEVITVSCTSGDRAGPADHFREAKFSLKITYRLLSAARESRPHLFPGIQSEITRQMHSAGIYPASPKHAGLLSTSGSTTIRDQGTP